MTNSTIRYAIVRPLPATFTSAISQHPPGEPIDLGKAYAQHKNYTEILRVHVPRLISLPVDDDHPDSCFVEDTAFVCGNDVLITRIGTPSRRDESLAVYQLMLKIKAEIPDLRIHNLREPATLDGGDVLVINKKIFVGKSSRTNTAAIEQLNSIFPGQVKEIPVKSGLHLKSTLSCLDDQTLIVWDNKAAISMAEAIINALSNTSAIGLVKVPDSVAANVLRIGRCLMVQKGYPKSEKILQDLCAAKSLELTPMPMSELVKVDGALTCCSILIS